MYFHFNSISSIFPRCISLQYLDNLIITTINYHKKNKRIKDKEAQLRNLLNNTRRYSSTHSAKRKNTSRDKNEIAPLKSKSIIKAINFKKEQFQHYLHYPQNEPQQ